MRWVAVVVIVVVVGVGAYFLPDLVPGLPGENPVQSPPTRSQKIAEKPRIFAAGIVEGLQSPLEIRFEMPGRIHAIRVSEGATVRANQVLAELECESYDLRVVQAKAQASIALLEMNRVKNREPSSQNASRQNSFGADEPERPIATISHVSHDEISIAQARAMAAEAAWKQEQLTLEKTRLKAPIAGTVLAVNMKAGDVVGPGEVSGTITVVNRGRTRVKAYVEELDAMNVAVGQMAKVIAGGTAERAYHGTVIACAPYVQPKLHRHLNPGERLDVRVRPIVVELEDGKDLLIGLPVEVFLDQCPPLPRAKPR